MKVSLCMIVKDEEVFLERCLESAKDLADEIVIVDTGSKDKTKEIAEKYTDKIFDFEWCDDFAAARNFSLSKATGDWILILDADEVIDSQSKAKIREIIKTNADGVILTKKEYRKSEKWAGFNPKDTHDKFTREYAGYTITPVISLFRRKKEIFFEGEVHETVGKSMLDSRLKIAEAKDIVIHHYKEDKGDNDFRERQQNYMRILIKMIAKNPDNARAHYKLAGIYNNILHDHYKALEHLQQAYKLGYNEGYCLDSIGGIQLALGKENEAEKTFIKALGKGISFPSIYQRLSKIYMRRKDYRRAKIVLTELVKHKSVYKAEAVKALEFIDKQR